MWLPQYVCVRVNQPLWLIIAAYLRVCVAGLTHTWYDFIYFVNKLCDSSKISFLAMNGELLFGYTFVALRFSEDCVELKGKLLFFLFNFPSKWFWKLVIIRLLHNVYNKFWKTDIKNIYVYTYTENTTILYHIKTTPLLKLSNTINRKVHENFPISLHATIAFPLQWLATSKWTTNFGTSRQ